MEQIPMPMRGFTLVELLVVMTISAILVAAAIPSFQWFMATTRASNATNDLTASFELARSEAIRRGTVVTVCRSPDPNAPPAALVCSNAAAGPYAAGDWASGWIMFEKRAAGPNDAYVDGTDNLLRVQQPFIGNRRVIIEANFAGGAIAYGRLGTAAAGGGAGILSVDYRDPAVPVLSGAARCVAVSAGVGLVTSYRPAPVC